MSSITIIIAIVALLCVLVCGAFVSQTIQQRREKRNRLIAALKAKSRKFKTIITLCPKGFLSRDLKVLTLRNLIEACENLSKIEADQPSHLQDVQTYSTELNEAQRQAPQEAAAPITNASVFPQLKACLDELNHFVINMESKQALARNQADAFKAQIKLLTMKISVDQSEMQGQIAKDSGQLKLALHYYTIALHTIQKEAKGSVLENKVPALKKLLKHVQALIVEESQSHDDANKSESSESADSDPNKVSAEWDKFEDENDSWKKKNIYD